MVMDDVVLCKDWTRFLFLKTETHCNQRIKEDFCFAIKPSATIFLHKNNPLAYLLLHLISSSVFLIFHILFSWIPLLHHKKRIKIRVVRKGGRLEGWFSGDNELIEKYRFGTSKKVINNPKVVSFGWLKSQKLDDVRRLLKEQLLKRFLEMKGNIYPDLIRVFYTNLKFEGNNVVSHVKGVDMEITHEVWAAVTGLKYAGLRINKGNIGVVEDFNKIQYYKSCLKNPHAQVRTCYVGGLKLNERLLALIVTWILTPRGSNHYVLTEEDLVYIYFIMSKVKINWIYIIKEHMQKSEVK